MKHAEKLIDRIIFLEGVPEIARYDTIRAGTSVKEQFEFDLALETKGVHAYNAAIALAIEENDAGSRDLMDEILVDSEELTITWSNPSGKWNSWPASKLSCGAQTQFQWKLVTPPRIVPLPSISSGTLRTSAAKKSS